MIETKRLKIISLEEKHCEPLRQLRNDPTTWHWLTDINPISEIKQTEWFRKLQLDDTKLYMAIMNKPQSTTIYGFVPDPQFIGILRSDEWDLTNRSVRVGIDIVSNFRGMGYGTEALTVFVDYLFQQHGIHRLWLLVIEDNHIARKLYEKLGFREEGIQKEAIWRDRKWHNYISMSLLEYEWKRKK